MTQLKTGGNGCDRGPFGRQGCQRVIKTSVLDSVGGENRSGVPHPARTRGGTDLHLSQVARVVAYSFFDGGDPVVAQIPGGRGKRFQVTSHTLRHRTGQNVTDSAE